MTVLPDYTASARTGSTRFRATMRHDDDGGPPGLPGSEDRDAEAGTADAGRAPAGHAVRTVQRMRQGRLCVQGRSPAQARAVLPGELHLAGTQPHPVRAPG